MAVVQAAVPSSRRVLDNGLTVLAVEDMSTQVAGIGLVINASAADEPDVRRGERALLQQLILTAGRAQLLESEQLVSPRVLASRGIVVHTDYELCEGLFSCAADELGAALKVAAQVFFVPPLDEAHLQEAKQLVREAYDQAHSTPWQATFELFRKAFYGSGPLAEALHAEPGLLAAVTPADIKTLHDEQYVASNAFLCVVAPLSAAEVMSEVEQAFGSLPTRSAPKAKPLPALPETSEVEVGSSEALGQASMVVGVALPPFGSDDFLVGELIVELLQGPGGRIERDRALLQALGLAIPSRLLDEHYPIEVMSVPISRQPFLAAHALCAPSSIERTRQGLLRHLVALRTQSVSDNEMARARARVINRHALENARPSGAALRLCRYEAFGSAEQSLHIADRLESVTKEDLTTVALKYFGRHAIGVQMPGR